MSTSLLWIRNDLRIDDNPALDLALEQGCQQAVFFVTPHQWQQHDVADIKQDFILRHAKLLQFQLKQVGVQLQIIEVENYAEQVVLLQRYCEKHQIKQIFANKELELNEIERDRELISSGINLTLTQADTILPLGAVLNKQGLMFKVFTPYKKAWLKQFSITPFHIKPAMTTLPAYVEDHNVGRSANWPLSDHYLVNFFPQFLQHKIANYDEERDFPALPATSRVSPYLAIGAISVKRLVHQLMINQSQPNFSIEFGLESIGEQTWLSELIWREFYRNLLFHYPNLIKGKSFVEKYDNLLWPDHHELFLKWCDGKTGFPIIDAAMRQLKQIGWMHNRLRMVVASFLTKNLLVNWRLGERYFMQHLIDGDFAANNGGWQWSAGTGCDAQPYFRVFNPISQSKKFDPNGDFIRKYLPELKNVPAKDIHQPHKYLAETGQLSLYWSEIVDLKSSRQRAIEFYGMKYDSESLP